MHGRHAPASSAFLRNVHMSSQRPQPWPPPPDGLRAPPLTARPALNPFSKPEVGRRFLHRASAQRVTGSLRAPKSPPANPMGETFPRARQSGRQTPVPRGAARRPEVRGWNPSLSLRVAASQCDRGAERAPDFVLTHLNRHAARASWADWPALDFWGEPVVTA